MRVLQKILVVQPCTRHCVSLVQLAGQVPAGLSRQYLVVLPAELGRQVLALPQVAVVQSLSALQGVWLQSSDCFSTHLLVKVLQWSLVPQPCAQHCEELVQLDGQELAERWRQ